MSNVSIIKSLLTGEEIKTFDFSQTTPDTTNRPDTPHLSDSYSSITNANQSTPLKFDSLIQGRQIKTR